MNVGGRSTAVNTSVIVISPASGIPAAPTETKAKILVIDDDKQVRRFISESLRQMGYTVTNASNGQEGLVLLQQDPVDLLVIDFAMPGMNGAEVARAAREMHAPLKILMVSGYADSAAIESLLGATPLLRKPFDVAGLGATVADILQR